MKKPSHKNLIIALGILVAAFILITSVYFKDSGKERNSMKVPEKNFKPAAILQTVVQKFTSKTSL